MKAKFRYMTNCVNCQNVPALNKMIEVSREILYKTAAKYIDMEAANIRLGYGPAKKRRCPGLSLETDYAVSFHISTYQGRRCYYIRHSAIEYIWIRESE